MQKKFCILWGIFLFPLILWLGGFVCLRKLCREKIGEGDLLLLLSVYTVLPLRDSLLLLLLSFLLLCISALLLRRKTLPFLPFLLLASFLLFIL